FKAAPPAQAEDVVVTAVVQAGSIPPAAPVILSPPGESVLTTVPVPVSGTCPPGFIIKLFRNDVFSGSALCSAEGTFLISTDLLVGKNVLVARVFNAANNEGPRSADHVLYYAPPGAVVPPSTSQPMPQTPDQTIEKDPFYIT